MIKIIVRVYIRIVIQMKRFKKWKTKKPVLKTGKVVIIYRISDAGYKKNKPDFINNENCLKNAAAVFPSATCTWHVIADNCCDETMNMIYRYIPRESVQAVSVGHGAGTFNLGYDLALQYEDDDIIYFLENDYIHKSDAMKILIEGININANCEYVTLYDHPDKYDGNHWINFIDDKTDVYLSESTHWKITSSTTMTLAAKVKTLKRDEPIFRRWTNGKHPNDFRVFMNLRLKKIRLISPIPSVSTHGEIAHMGALVDWKTVYESMV